MAGPCLAVNRRGLRAAAAGSQRHCQKIIETNVQSSCGGLASRALICQRRLRGLKALKVPAPRLVLKVPPLKPVRVEPGAQPLVRVRGRTGGLRLDARVAQG